MEKRFCPYCMTAVEEGESCPTCGLTAGAYTPSPHHIPPGTVLMDRYLVGRVLGEGGFGITYIGCDLRLELKVAIKEYFPTDKVTRHAGASLAVTSYIGAAAAGYQQGKERFLHEARTMARMDKQPNIVSVRDFFEANNTAYIVMEYVEGTTFKELVAQKGGRIPPTELLPMIEPLFSVLTAMHELGLIHRDISPDNLMLENGKVRLLDFGCARESSRGTETMTIALKHGYAPIEQYQHKGQGPWTDVYGLSATLYFCLTGKTPPQALDRLCDDELILPRKLGIPLTERQERALLYGMGIRVRRRFQSVEELHTALYQADVPLPCPPEETPAPETPPVPVKPPAAEVPPGAVTVIEPLFEVRSAPAAEPEFSSTGEPAPEPGPVEAATALMEAPAPQPAPAPQKKKRLAVLGGAVAAVVIVAVLLAVLLPRGDDPAARSQPPAGSTAPVVTDVPDGRTATLTGDAGQLGQQLLDAIADDSIASIIVPGNMGAFGVPGDAVTINKPVLVKEGTELDFHGPLVTVTGGGSLRIEGLLAVDQVCVFSDGGQLELADTGALMGDGLLWFDSEEDYVCHEKATVGMDGVHFLFGDPDSLFDDALVVTSELDLRRAQQWGRTAIIPAGTKLTLAREFTQIMPVLIEEGAEVVSGRDAAWAVYETLLINRGTLSGWIWVAGGENGLGQIVNQGILDATEAFFLEPDATLYNALDGQVLLKGTPEFAEGSLTVNCGTITGALHLTGRLLNLGAMVNEGDGSFDINPGGRFVNRGPGEVDIYSGFFNQGNIFNGGGTITIHDGAGFENWALLETESILYLGENIGAANYGVIRWLPNGYIDRPELLDYMIYDNSSGNWNNGMDVVEISTARELIIWAARGDCAATLTGDITVEGELTVTTSLEIPEGVTLRVDDLTISGPTVRLMGTLEARELSVLDGALLYNGGDIRVQEGGVLRVEASGQLVCEGRELDLPSARLLVAGGGLVYVANLEQYNIARAEIAEGGRLVTQNAAMLDGAHLTIQTASVVLLRGADLQKLDLTMEGDAFFFANSLGLEAGQWTVNSGRIRTYNHIRLGEGVTVVNHGTLDCGICTREFAAVQVAGVFENHGAVLLAGLSLEVPGHLDNQGVLYYGWGSTIDGNVTGNPAQVHPDFE